MSHFFCSRRSGASVALSAFALALVILLVCLHRLTAPAMAHNAEAMGVAAPLTVTAFLRTSPNQCHQEGADVAMRRLASEEVARLNQLGGVYGRPLALRFVEEPPIAARQDGDAAGREALYAAVEATLADPDALAMIGLSRTPTAHHVFQDFSASLAESDIPIITDVSVSSVLQRYQHAFSTQPAQEVERGPVIAAFLNAQGFRRIALITREDAVWAQTVTETVEADISASRVVGAYGVALAEDNALDRDQLSEIRRDLTQLRPDAVVLAVGSGQTAAVLDALGDLRAAMVTIGDLETVQPSIDPAYPNPIYGLAWTRLPEIENERLQRLVNDGPRENWVFEGARNDAAPGWSNGRCAERPSVEPQFRDPLDAANARAIQRGATMADMIRLAAAAAIDAGPDAAISQQRQAIAAAITETYASGSGVFRGAYGDWSFDPAARVASQTPLIVILPSGLGRLQLAPTQFIRARNGDLNAIDTLYADVDLVSLQRVDENERSFFAEFYLAMRATDGGSIDRIEFANAYLDPRIGGRMISIEELHGGGPSASYPATMKIYKVSGRFVFDPALEAYPFDRQRFAIDVRPANGADNLFIVQPPPDAFRDQNVASDDWVATAQFVSVDTDFVPVVDAFTHKPSVVPFYTSSFVWMMDRETNDYYLRVVVPLAFILTVAYLSIFIPRGHFEAIITIQVTALLSAVALYLSLPQLDSDAATVSDRIFLLDYLLISVMIGISIVRITKTVSQRRWLSGLLAGVHIVVIPVAVGVVAFVVSRDAGQLSQSWLG